MTLKSSHPDFQSNTRIDKAIEYHNSDNFETKQFAFGDTILAFLAKKSIDIGIKKKLNKI